MENASATLLLTPEKKERQIRIDILVSVLLFLVVSVLFYTFRVGTLAYSYQILWFVLVSFITSVGVELLFDLRYLFKKSEEGRFKSFVKAFIESDSYLYGLILVLFLPLGLKLYEVSILAACMILLSNLMRLFFKKLLFHPICLALLIMTLFFSSSITVYMSDVSLNMNNYNYDVYQMMNITIERGYSVLASSSYNLWRLFIGDYIGTIGSPFAIVSLLVGLYLSFRKNTAYQILLTGVFTFYIALFLLFIVGGTGLSSFGYGLRYLFIGDILLALLFVVTDRKLLPKSLGGQFLYLFLVTFFTMIMRLYYAKQGDIAIGILLADFFLLPIDQIEKLPKKKAIFVSASIVMLLLTFALPVIYGLNNPLEANGEFVNV